MWRVLGRPRWLGYLALALIFALVTTLLGLWQWHRHEDRVDRRTVVEANYFGDPVPLDDVLPGSDPLDPEDQWTRVSVQGTYAAQDQHLVRNRPHQRVYGYEVMVPLLLEDGTALGVDRGWVPNAPTAQQLPDVPDAPEGQVTLTGWLRPSEPDLGREMVPGQLASIDLPRLAAATDQNLRGGYLVLEEETPPPAARPAQLDAPDTGLGSHFAYALQWWLTAPVGLVLVLVMARREAQEEAGPGDPRGSPPDPADPRTPRRKKVRIWDEEDE